MNEVVIVSGCRTAIGKFLGGLKDVSAKDLGIAAASEAIKRAGIPADTIDEIVVGQVYGHMQGSMVSRQISMAVGMSIESNACAVNQNCTSGMRALEIACNNVALGKTDISLVVGMESMSNVPYMLPKGRTGYRLGEGKVLDALHYDALFDSLVGGLMGVTSENVADLYNITRTECDELAVISHGRAVAATDSGKFNAEKIPVEIKSKKGSVFFDTDEHMIRGASMESVGKVTSIFKKDGVTTAANASGINDGAAAVIVMSKQKAKDLGITPLLKMVTITACGVEPEIMGIGPAEAIPKALKLAGKKFNDVDYWEINEAFASQFLGVDRRLQQKYDMKIDMNKCNANGSGIALGHPVGMTGLRLIVSMYYEMERRGDTLGGASLCVGTGPAMASLWTRDI